MTRSALILSPFSSWPETAGHRRRVAQATRLLAHAGFRVTFLLYAFEDIWAHRFDEASYDALRRQWPEVHVFHANAGVGGTPAQGERHAIDEWWDTALGAYLDNLFSRRRFDAFVVHNVWLSRAFLHAPAGTARILEIHDLFHRRAGVFSTFGLRPDFFVPTQAGEIEGLARADIVSTIQASEQDWIQQNLPGRGRLVPYFDASLPRHAIRRADYLDGDVVRFGILASGHSLNLHGISSLLDVLRAAPEADRRRVRLRIGGAAARFIAPAMPCERMPEVATEAGFYAGCDIAVVPNLAGTGFKIKIADALGLGMPVLATRHAAEGIDLPAASTITTAQDLAARICAIARDRPPLATLRAEAARAAVRLRREAARGAARLVTAISRKRPVLRIDLTPFTPGAGILPLLVMLHANALRELLDAGHPQLLVGSDVAALVADLLPDGVEVTRHQGRLSRSTQPTAWAAAEGFRRLRAWQSAPHAVPTVAKVAMASGLGEPGMRHEPMVARLLWARRSVHRSTPFDERPVLIARASGAGHRKAQVLPPRAGRWDGPLLPAFRRAGWNHVDLSRPMALEELAVAMIVQAGRARMTVCLAIADTPERGTLEMIAQRTGHNFVVLRP